MHHALKLHPDSRCAAVTGIDVSVSRLAPAELLLHSYWAAAHPTGNADFHHADGFAIDLPAAD